MEKDTIYKIQKTVLFNLTEEIERINLADYDERQKSNLITLYSLFCANKLDECIEFVTSKEYFQEREREHIHEIVYDVLWQKAVMGKRDGTDSFVEINVAVADKH